MTLHDIKWNPDENDLKKFGQVFFVGFLVAGCACFIKGWNKAALFCIIAGLVVVLLGAVSVKLVLPVYFAWMGLAYVTGSIVSNIIFILVYFGIITPVALIMRAMKRDVLKLRPPKTNTYWDEIPIRDDASRHERQF